MVAQHTWLASPSKENNKQRGNTRCNPLSKDGPIRRLYSLLTHPAMSPLFTPLVTLVNGISRSKPVCITKLNQVPALSVCNSSVLALFASGRTRGLALEVGGGVAHAVPVFEGFALNHAILKLEGAGQDITHQLKATLERKGHHLSVRVFATDSCVSKFIEGTCVGLRRLSIILACIHFLFCGITIIGLQIRSTHTHRQQ